MTLTGISTGIAGVAVNTVCKQTDAASFNLKTLCKSDADESADVDSRLVLSVTLTSDESWRWTRIPLRMWTPAAVSAAQFGFQLV